jgi:Family of unknown function (DUF6516)
MLEQLTTVRSDVISTNMKAALLLDERHQVADAAFAELRMWRVPTSVRGSSHDFKYALAFIVREKCVLRYDNEAGKGDHRHLGDIEFAYRFTTVDRLLADFWHDVDEWKEP